MKIFSTKGAEKRKQHGSKGSTVFRDPNEDDRVWVLFDWDAGGLAELRLRPRGPGDHAGGRAQGQAAGGGARRPVRGVSAVAPASERRARASRLRGLQHRPDRETLSELLDANAAWHTPGLSPLAGDVVGRDAIFAQFGRYGGETGGTSSRSQRVAHRRRRPRDRDPPQHRRAGRQASRCLLLLVFELEDGRIVDGREHFFDLDAWDEFWS